MNENKVEMSKEQLKQVAGGMPGHADGIPMICVNPKCVQNGRVQLWDDFRYNGAAGNKCPFCGEPLSDGGKDVVIKGKL